MENNIPLSRSFSNDQAIWNRFTLLKKMICHLILHNTNAAWQVLNTHTFKKTPVVFCDLPSLKF